jgi:hypothetical protein
MARANKSVSIDAPSAAHLVLYPINNKMARPDSSIVLMMANKGIRDPGANEFTDFV